MITLILALTRVLYVSAFTEAGLADNITWEIANLENSIDSQKVLDVKNIQIMDHPTYLKDCSAYVTYEIKDKSE